MPLKILPPPAHRSGHGQKNYAIVQAKTSSLQWAWSLAQLERRTRFTHQRPGRVTDERVLGLAYFAEVPAVLVDVQRAGPLPACPPAPSNPTFSRRYALTA
ncbi:MAG: hypothetical protein CM15mP125_3440 [Gammaproteobacteria bacterium]|nr:MAG: hypothetical protein CM15mP125_3440 [Gammaproteobacteria bacterium]